jgi:hypothetical protein
MSNFNLPIVLRILDNENRLTDRADQKSISLLSILGVFMVFFIVYYRVIPINIFTAVLIILYFLLALLSIFNLIMAIRPRILKGPGEIEGTSEATTCDPAFFSGICSFPSLTVYKEALQEMLKDEMSISNVYIQQIFSVARINSVKYRHIQRGVLLVIMSLAIELLLIGYLFIYYVGAEKMPPIT